MRDYKRKVHDELGQDQKIEPELLETAGSWGQPRGPFVRTSRMTLRSSCGVFALPAVGRLPHASSSQEAVLLLIR